MDRVSAALAASEATLRHRLTWIKDISTVGPMSEIEREKVHRFVAEALAIIESPAPASGEPAHDREAAMIGLEYVMTLLDGATPGPWMWSDNGNIIPEAYSQDCEIAAVYTNREDDAAPVNASAIIAAVNWLRKHGRTLRAADNCDAAGVQTVKREPKP